MTLRGEIVSYDDLDNPSGDTQGHSRSRLPDEDYGSKLKRRHGERSPSFDYGEDEYDDNRRRKRREEGEIIRHDDSYRRRRSRSRDRHYHSSSNVKKSRSRSDSRDRYGRRTRDRRSRSRSRTKRRGSRRNDGKFHDNSRSRSRSADKRKRSSKSHRRSDSRGSRSRSPRERKDRDDDGHQQHRRRHHEYSRSISRERDSSKKSINPDSSKENSIHATTAPMDIAEMNEEEAMMAFMGFGGFDSTKGKHVEGSGTSAANVKVKRDYRQYMNRKGGFNRLLDDIQ